LGVHLISRMENWETSGKIWMVWFGPTPRVILSDAKLVREVLSKFGHFQKRKLPSNFIKLIAQGLTVHEGEKWALHRKIIKPAFHLEKLKVMNGPILCETSVKSRTRRYLCIDSITAAENCRKCCRLSLPAPAS